ncbi:ATP-dependent protease ATPase subunit HslU [Lutispora thermophila]|uniref:ATP-dependent protease ATPase subunit HslU n=1 Tax=Lutispora thermophila DSM 19022 TaxID=1122184 RepID=A0A1M6G691_9FIRM|nr:ATP-dependent protease ATPase subunit HslU [Lutispora thermophila]SHJ05449.1 ATP-dependent HslUV protease ATP-binding subunit HslU [Lutispora thermophila DSM 19022]
MIELTPKQIVEELDKYIIGQESAKKSVAVALRNRYRRNQLPDELKNEITPKNILMIGPTGVGKTEIARRLAKLVNAPFVKVEATKFTEVGYVGRDVESMIRDIVEASIRIVKAEKTQEVNEKAYEAAIDYLGKILVPSPIKNRKDSNPFEALFNYQYKDSQIQDDDKDDEKIVMNRFYIKEKIKKGELDNQIVEIEVEDSSSSTIDMFTGAGIEQMSINIQDMLGNIFPKKVKKKKVTIKDAIKILTQQEAQKLIDMDAVIDEAIVRAEEKGIIFIDEIDKIAGKDYSGGPDVSREGVQRDILPIVEGSTVMTKYGPVKTDHMLFIAAGAFHVSKVSDLIPELQGRFPVRVELTSLTKENFKEILTKPNNALIKQYKALLSTEGLEIDFDEEAINEIAEIAAVMNEQTEDIGARRLYTVMEKLFEELSFNAPDMEEKQFIITKDYVRKTLSNNIKEKDTSRYII